MCGAAQIGNVCIFRAFCASPSAKSSCFGIIYAGYCKTIVFTCNAGADPVFFYIVAEGDERDEKHATRA